MLGGFDRQFLTTRNIVFEKIGRVDLNMGPYDSLPGVGRCRNYIHPTATTNFAMVYNNMTMKTGDYGLAIICYSKAFEIELKYFSPKHF